MALRNMFWGDSPLTNRGVRLLNCGAFAQPFNGRHSAGALGDHLKPRHNPTAALITFTPHAWMRDGLADLVDKKRRGPLRSRALVW